MTKIDIISGFLGAGKTTLMKKLIEDVYVGEKVVIVENEFGEIGIDGGFLKDTGITVSELNSGCICCTLVGDFTKNLHEVIATYTPDRILIEPSGVGKLSDVMASVMDVEKTEDVKLNALVTVVNALKASKQMKAFGEFFNDQIAHATTIVLSRTQNATPEQLEFCHAQIKALNPKAAVITTPWDEISGTQMLAVMEGQDSLEMRALAELHHAQEEAEHEAEHHHHHHHDEDEEHEHEHHHHHHDDDDDDDEHEHEHHHHHHDDDDDDEHEHEHHHHHDDDDDDHDHEHGHHHHHHHADDVFDTWGRETPHVFDRAVIEKAMAAFADTEDYGYVVRSKGIVPASDGTWLYFDLVDGEWEIRTGDADYTGRLVVIGTDLKEKEIEALFGLT